MCVIFVTGREKRVPEAWVAAGYEHNGAGAGIAYRGKGGVVWKKGMGLDEVQELNTKVPLPYALHFRIPTCGGSIKKLTHPFPIETSASLALEGVIKGSVLFHNGHWGRWKDIMLESASRGRIKIPGDKWSDSRAMAWMAAHFGMGVLDIIDEKICAFGTEHIEIYGNGWQVKDQIWCSNLHWEFAAKKWDHPGKDWRKTDKDDSDDKEEISQNQFTTPPNSMVPGERRAVPLYPTYPIMTPGHTAYCSCSFCEKRKKELKERAIGGALTETPFDLAKRVWLEADRKWKMVPHKISKKKWKKAFKMFEEAERKVKVEQIRSGMVEFQRNVVDGMIPIH